MVAQTGLARARQDIVDGRVSVLGLGNMGAALALRLARSGYTVTGWNRSSTRAAALVSQGVSAAASAAEAIVAGPVTIACLLDYAALTHVLADEEVASACAGRTIINVGTGTPAEVERMRTCVESRGAAYLDGSIFVFPRSIGDAKTIVLYSGPVATWEQHEAMLMTFGGRSRHVGELIGAASIIEVAAAGIVGIVGLGAFLEGAAFAEASGVSVTELIPVAQAMLELVHEECELAGKAIASRRYETDQATLDVYLSGSRRYLRALEDVGQRAALMRGMIEYMEGAQARGFGDVAVASVHEVLVGGSPTTALTPG